MIIVKAGGSAITDKTKESTPRVDVIESIAYQLSSSEEKIILVHGGGSYGHFPAKKFELHLGFKNEQQIEGVSYTRHSMTVLNQIVVSSLMKHKIPAVSLQPSACFLCTRGRISLSFLEPLKAFLDLGLMPVLYGDVVTDSEMGFCILSGDQIVSYLSEKFNPRKVIFGLDVDGLYTKDPKEKDAQLIREITFSELSSVSGEETGDVTRGMKGKLQEILKMKTEVNLINLMKEGTLLKALRENVEGTRIR